MRRPFAGAALQIELKEQNKNHKKKKKKAKTKQCLKVSSAPASHRVAIGYVLNRAGAQPGAL